MKPPSSEPRKIRFVETVDCEVSVPPSKSYTNRALVISALANGVSTISNPSASDDVEYLVSALRAFGIAISRFPDRIEVVGSGGTLSAPREPIFVGNAGTTLRFLVTFASLANGETLFHGDERMHQRPLKGLLEALRSAGIRCSSRKGFPPVKVFGGSFRGGEIFVDASVSSQFASSILLSAPYAAEPVFLKIGENLSSFPYIQMSLHVMRAFGAEIEENGPFRYLIENSRSYRGRAFHIEGDASSATYFLAAAAITGGRVRIRNLAADSLQGDGKFAEILESMGCLVSRTGTGLEIQGKALRGIDVDMNAVPDCVPTLAVVAAFAEGTTNIFNVAHLRHKETDRLKAIACELSKIGVAVRRRRDGLSITPRALRSATIETYSDHRMAMSFAVAGLRIKGLEILNPGCVSKSFPGFWSEFEKLEPHPGL